MFLTNVPFSTHEVVRRQHFDILVEGLAEVKATSDGYSDQPIADIVAGIIEEIKALPECEPVKDILIAPVDFYHVLKVFKDGDTLDADHISKIASDLYAMVQNKFEIKPKTT